MAIRAFLGRNLVSIAFPTIVAAAIYADWSYTRQWKAQHSQQGSKQ